MKATKLNRGTSCLYNQGYTQKNRNWRSLFMIFFVLLFTSRISAQIDSTNPKAVHLSKKNLTYYWIGISCFQQDNSMNEYGFRIVCVGCIAHSRYIVHNSRIVRKINRVYGKNWFEKNIR